MTNRQARALAGVKKAYEALKSEADRRAFQDKIRALGLAGVIREYGAKVSDVKDKFGSVKRRERQERWDTEELLAPVLSPLTPSGAGTEVYLALRPVAERVAARRHEGNAAGSTVKRERRKLRAGRDARSAAAAPSSVARGSADDAG